MFNPTMGVELEFQYMNPCALNGLHDILPFRLDDDGSIRNTTYTINNGALAVVPIVSKGQQVTAASGLKLEAAYGLELVTSPLPYDILLQNLQRLVPYIEHIPSTPRTSIHIHVDVANTTWRYIQRVLRWSYHLEAVLFRLSCGGNVHRGEMIYKNRGDEEGTYTDYRYCRPLSTPIGVNWGGVKKPLIDIGLLLNANTPGEFLAAWGRLDLYGPENKLPKYVPHRLHMVNLAALPQYGTIEWRLFDGIYKHVGLFTELVKSIHELAHKGHEPLFEPFLLGEDTEYHNKTLDADRVSDLLHLDISKLWGRRWPLGCSTGQRESHYHNRDFNLCSLAENPANVWNGVENSDDAVLYRRGC